MIQVVPYMCLIRRGFKKKLHNGWKKFQSSLDHYNLINKEESMVQIWYESTILN